jgi:uncharacterized protein YlxW (UPF0749 family)
MMTRSVVSVLIMAVIGGVVVSAQTSPSVELANLKAEAHVLRVENAQLRSVVARLQAEMELLRLTSERQALEVELRKELKPPEDHLYDWQARRFVAPAPEKK